MAEIRIIGAGPNGLAAAIHLARNGKKVKILEAESTLGGAARTAELTLPGFRHDLASAVHPLAVTSPFLSGLPLGRHGLNWIYPPLALAHPLDDGTAILLSKSITDTAESLGIDSRRYRQIFEYLTPKTSDLFADILGPIKIPEHPIVLSRFGLLAIQSAKSFVAREFKGERGRALFAGIAAHSSLDLGTPTSAAIGLVLSLAAHTAGWPIPEGGAGKITEAMARYLQELDGEIECSHPISALEELDGADAVFFDINPRQLLKITHQKIPDSYRRSLTRFKKGPGVFKLDWALSDPIPWKASECLRAGTVHLGGSFAEIAKSEELAVRGEISERPFVLLSQPTLFDPSRAPLGKHIAWAYCHVPWGSLVDMTEKIESQIERFAPGFKDVILKRTRTFPADLERQNRCLEGGDITGGAATPMQLFFRPAPRWDPYKIPGNPWWICSASSPPGPGVHGMCGYQAAKAALKRGL
jgi:phytoene dehydrogenase-like protein